MRNVRVKFTKDGKSRYISHLDLNRCMLRAVHKSKIPVWYTEGFNPHPFITFALPLSLGVRGKCEFMDMKIVEEISNDDIKYKLNECLPDGINIVNINEPIMKLSDICYADFNIRIYGNNIDTNKIFEELNELLNKKEIIVEKKTKSGIKNINFKEYINRYNVLTNDDYVNLDITLCAGNNSNVNPNLLLNLLIDTVKDDLYTDISRIKLYDKDMLEFE